MSNKKPKTAKQLREEEEKQLRDEAIERKFASKSDRQLLEEQTHLAQLDNKNTKNIKNNVQFFFWLAILSIIVWIIIGLNVLIHS
jgi:hypothetical protein